MSHVRKTARHAVKKAVKKIEADAAFIKAQLDNLLAQVIHQN